MADDIEDDPVPPIELRRFDIHSAWRILLWGASAAMAVAIVAGTAFSDLGAERLKQTMATLLAPAKMDAPPPQPTQQVAQRLAPSVTLQQFAALESQTRGLALTVRELTADREALKAKLASVQQNLDDITGSIKKQAAQLAASKELPQHAATAPPPVISAPDTVAAVASPPADPAATAPSTPITTAVPPSPGIEAAAAPEAPIPLPPARTAALEENAPTTRELGVDVGGSASLDGLRARWTTLKANAGPDIVGLLPSFAVRQKPGGGTDYRLVLGPLPSNANAFRLCTKLIAARINCRTGTFSVQRLADATPVQIERSTGRLPAPSPADIMTR